MPTKTKVVFIEKYRKVLLDKRAEFASLRRMDSRRTDDKEYASDEDLAPICHEEYVRTGTSQLVAEQLRQIESAIHRLDTGEYGTCASCGSHIALKRLDAVPWAKYCVEC